MLGHTPTEITRLERRFPVLATVAEHECAGVACPCFTVLEVLCNLYEWHLEGGQMEETFTEYVERHLRPRHEGCECGDPDCRADHNADTAREYLFDDRC
jgi:hypothetical protein